MDDGVEDRRLIRRIRSAVEDLRGEARSTLPRSKHSLHLALHLTHSNICEITYLANIASLAERLATTRSGNTINGALPIASFSLVVFRYGSWRKIADRRQSVLSTGCAMRVSLHHRASICALASDVTQHSRFFCVLPCKSCSFRLRRGLW